MSRVFSRRSVVGLAAVGAAALLPSVASAACTDEDEANKETVRRWIEEVWNAGNLDLLDQIAAEDFQPDRLDEAPGRDALKARTADARQGFIDLIPDVRYTIEDLFAADGKVALRGLIMGATKSGKQINALYINLLIFKGAQIMSVWAAQDDYAVAAAL